MDGRTDGQNLQFYAENFCLSKPVKNLTLFFFSLISTRDFCRSCESEVIRDDKTVLV